eukprot:scaffold20550_cov127-Isochrysis_galbana.AAC.1
MAARCQALPTAKHPSLTDTQQQSGTSNPGRPARAVSHPTLNLRKALVRDTDPQPDSSLTTFLYLVGGDMVILVQSANA